FAPSRRHRQHFVTKLFPCGRALVAVDSLYPKQKSQPRRRGSRILDDYLQVAIGVHQSRQARRWSVHGLLVIDESEIAVVVRHEDVVREAAWNLNTRCIGAVGREEPGVLGFV